jgi:hypothetical protein
LNKIDVLVFELRRFKHRNRQTKILEIAKMTDTCMQGVTEIGALILTGNRTRQKEQLFYLPFFQKTMFNSKKKKNWRDFSLK